MKFLFSIGAALRTLLTMPCLIRATSSTNHRAAGMFETEMALQACVQGIAAGACPVAAGKGILARGVAGGF